MEIMAPFFLDQIKAAHSEKIKTVFPDANNE